MKSKRYAFAIRDAKVINENPNSKFAVISLDFFASGENLNNFYVSEEVLMKNADTIKGAPILFMIDDVLDDFYTHDPEQKICGFVPDNAEIISRKMEDGRTMLSTVAFLWKRYTDTLIEIFKRDGGKKPVSVEMVVDQIRRLPNGLKELINYSFEGITILGSYVTPAIAGATANVLSFAELEKEYIQDFKEEFSDGKIIIDPSFLESLKEGDVDSVPSQAGTDEAEKEMKEMNMKKKLEEKQPEEQDVAQEEEFEQNEDVEESQEMAESQETQETQESEEPITQEMAEGEDEEEETDTEEQACKDDKEEYEEDEEVEKASSDEKESDGEEEVSENSLWKNFNLDVLLSLFEKDSDVSVELEKGEEADPAIVIEGLYKRLSESQKRLEQYKKDLDELHKFKADVEKSQKEFAVEQTLRELSDKVIIPEDAREKMVQEAEKYSLEDLEGWKNYCKALSFDFAVKEKEVEGQVTKVGLPFGKAAGKKKKDLWS